MAAVNTYAEPDIPFAVIGALEHQTRFSGLLLRQPLDLESMQQNSLPLMYQKDFYFSPFLKVRQSGKRDFILPSLFERKKAGLTGMFNFYT